MSWLDCGRSGPLPFVMHRLQFPALSCVYRQDVVTELLCSEVRVLHHFVAQARTRGELA